MSCNAWDEKWQRSGILCRFWFAQDLTAREEFDKLFYAREPRDGFGGRASLAFWQMVGHLVLSWGQQPSEDIPRTPPRIVIRGGLEIIRV
eukprot:3542967-Lingulodinium_polyedra.AAC.1